MTIKNEKLLKDKYGVSGEYILFVGTLQPRKNIVRLIEAFARVLRGPAYGAGRLPHTASDARQPSSEASGPHKSSLNERQLPKLDTNSKEKPKLSFNSLAGGKLPIAISRRLQLVIIGKKGWMYKEILEAPGKFGVSDRVKFLDAVPDEDLPVFYQNAICFVLPSLYEGFGLPILEAMKYGCPVLTSNVSSLPEAGGDAALYFDPYDVKDIAKNLELIIQDADLRKELVEKGYEQVKKFSWEKAARETLNVLEEVVKTK